MNFLRRNFVFILAITAVTIVIVSFAVLNLRRGGIKPVTSPLPTITPQPSARQESPSPGFLSPSPSAVINRPISGKEYQSITDIQIQQTQRSSLIAKLINKLPYYGNSFSLFYNINSNQFVVVFDNNQVDLASQEFDRFLLDNSIQDRSWIKNLIIKQQ